MLKGIDISSWQKGINLSYLTNDIDFCIMKATEGLYYQDPYFADFMLQAIDNGLLRGIYHFARENNPEDEARYFYGVVKEYIGKAVIVLDYETENWDNVQWCEYFMKTFYNLSGVYPMLYISAYRCAQYSNSWIPEKCGLWLAGYPAEYSSFDVSPDFPYNISPWEFAAIWQFTSNLQLNGYYSRLDGNFAYMDAIAWDKYAKCTDNGTIDALPIPEPVPAPIPNKSTIEICKEVLQGYWGNGDDRKYMLEDAGYDYKTVQDTIDEYYRLANEIWLGYWGNGWNRKTALEGVGYDYDLAQMCVDAMIQDSYDGC